MHSAIRMATCDYIYRDEMHWVYYSIIKKEKKKRKKKKTRDRGREKVHKAKRKKEIWIAPSSG